MQQLCGMYVCGAQLLQLNPMFAAGSASNQQQQQQQQLLGSMVPAYLQQVAPRNSAENWQIISIASIQTRRIFAQLHRISFFQMRSKIYDCI